jgi:DNA-binding transcriptional regulator YiaG
LTILHCVGYNVFGMELTFIDSASFLSDARREKLRRKDIECIKAKVIEERNNWRPVIGFSELHRIRIIIDDHRFRVFFGTVADEYVLMLGVDQESTLTPTEKRRMQRLLASVTSVVAPQPVQEGLIAIAPTDYTPSDIQRLRAEAGMSQRLFAECMGISTVLVESWEQELRNPSLMARRLMDVINEDPAAFRKKWTVPANVANG